MQPGPTQQTGKPDIPATPPISSQTTAPLKGIFLMILGGLLLTVSDATSKHLAENFPPGQILALRGCFVIPPLALFTWRSGGWSALRITNFRGHALRGTAYICSAFLFVTSLALLPLADAIALAFVGPLFITALAPAFLGERVGWRRWLAVAVGFAGIVVMLRPGGEVMRWAALLPLGAAAFGACRDLLTRRMTASETSAAILATSTFCIIVAGFCTLPFGWIMPSAIDIAFLAATGLLVGAAHFCMIETYRYAEAALAAPYKYFTMVWAVLFGFVIWGDLPDGWMIAGAVLVIGSGLYILHREARRSPSKDRRE